MVLSDPQQEDAAVPLRNLTSETQGRIEQLRQLAANMRLASAALRESVDSRRSAAPVVEIRRVRAALERAGHLERALISNRRIGMAVGILMATRHLPEAEAFDCLRQESQRRNIKLRDLAEQVVYTGEL